MKLNTIFEGFVCAAFLTQGTHGQALYEQWLEYETQVGFFQQDLLATNASTFDFVSTKPFRQNL